MRIFNVVLLLFSCCISFYGHGAIVAQYQGNFTWHAGPYIIRTIPPAYIIKSNPLWWKVSSERYPPIGIYSETIGEDIKLYVTTAPLDDKRKAYLMSDWERYSTGSAPRFVRSIPSNGPYPPIWMDIPKGLISQPESSWFRQLPGYQRVNKPSYVLNGQATLSVYQFEPIPNFPKSNRPPRHRIISQEDLVFEGMDEFATERNAYRDALKADVSKQRAAVVLAGIGVASIAGYLLFKLFHLLRKGIRKWMVKRATRRKQRQVRKLTEQTIIQSTVHNELKKLDQDELAKVKTMIAEAINDGDFDKASTLSKLAASMHETSTTN